jgi:hypothetical protein
MYKISEEFTIKTFRQYQDALQQNWFEGHNMCATWIKMDSKTRKDMIKEAYQSCNRTKTAKFITQKLDDIDPKNNIIDALALQMLCKLFKDEKMTVEIYSI